MLKSLCALLIICLMIFGCSKTSEQGVSQDGKAASPRTSIVTYAEITSVNPTVQTAVIAQCQTQFIEGSRIAVRFRWYVDGSAVPAVEGNVLEPEFYSKGSRVEADVIPLIDGVASEPYKMPGVLIQNSPPAVTSVELTPSPAFPGDKISVVAKGMDPDKNDSITFTYEWEVNNEKVGDATTSVFDTAGLKKKSIISAAVTPYDGQDKGVMVHSATAIVLSNRNPEITSVPMVKLENGIYVYQVTARDPDGDSLSYMLEKGPQGMAIDPSRGLVRWQPPTQVLEKQDIAVRVSVDDGDGGKAFQDFSFSLGMK